jgi:3'-phosphoadenosine 5'-phosphosulfate (PAPS) 3'-phosphatase
LQGFGARDKADASPVTEADLAADHVIASRLSAAFPHDGLISEESHPRPSQSEHLWCVDPLDGTEAFIDGKARGYAVQIARFARSGDLWDLVLGVTFEPRFDELCFAARGHGAFVSVGGATSRVIRGASVERRLVVSNRVDERYCARLGAHGFKDAGRFRSVGVKVARLLRGEAEVYLATHALSWWDLAAPQLILEEAGGYVTDVHGARPVYAAGASHVLAGPLALTLGVPHRDVLDALRG